MALNFVFRQLGGFGLLFIVPVLFFILFKSFYAAVCADDSMKTVQVYSDFVLSCHSFVSVRSLKLFVIFFRRKEIFPQIHENIVFREATPI